MASDQMGEKKLIDMITSGGLPGELPLNCLKISEDGTIDYEKDATFPGTKFLFDEIPMEVTFDQEDEEGNLEIVGYFGRVPYTAEDPIKRSQVMKLLKKAREQGINIDITPHQTLQLQCWVSMGSKITAEELLVHITEQLLLLRPHLEALRSFR